MTEEILIDGINVAGCEYMLNNKIKGKQHCPAKAMPYAKETSCICRKSIDTPYNFCKHNPDCHYKQLKRLEFELKITKADYEASEQENKELKAYKNVNEDFKKAWDELNKKYTEVLNLAKLNADSNEYCLKKLEKENAKLKQENETLNYQWHKRAEIADEWYKLAEKYKSALEEIREIEELAYYSKGVPEEPLSQRDFILDAINNYEQRRIKILTKINEVLG